MPLRFLPAFPPKAKPVFYLVSARHTRGTWHLPLPTETLLAWLWQRWEREVAHREMKRGFGVGEKQCWNPHATIAAVQWSVWVYALLLLAAYHTWGLLNGPAIPTRGWSGAPRWSFNTLWRQYRLACWGTPQFQALWMQTSGNWLKKEDFLLGLSNAVNASARIQRKQGTRVPCLFVLHRFQLCSKSHS
jgi:hypothetical protein